MPGFIRILAGFLGVNPRVSVLGQVVTFFRTNSFLVLSPTSPRCLITQSQHFISSIRKSSGLVNKRRRGRRKTECGWSSLLCIASRLCRCSFRMFGQISGVSGLPIDLEYDQHPYFDSFRYLVGGHCLKITSKEVTTNFLLWRLQRKGFGIPGYLWWGRKSWWKVNQLLIPWYSCCLSSTICNKYS